MDKCFSCGADESSGDNFYSCNRCEQQLCLKCSRLSSTEARSAVLKKRRMMFLCDGCRGHYDSFVRAGSLDEVENGGADDEQLEEKFRRVVNDIIKGLIPNMLNMVVNKMTEQIEGVNSRFDVLLESVKRAEGSKVVPVIKKKTAGFMAPSVMNLQHVDDGAACGLESDGLQHLHGQLLSGDSRGPLASDRKSASVLVSTGPTKVRKCGQAEGQPAVADNTQIGPSGNESSQVALSQVRRGVKETMEGVTGCSKGEADAGFHVVEYKKRGHRRPATICRGTAKDAKVESGFVCEPKKMWLYVGRAGSQTTKETVTTYMKGRLGDMEDDQLVVESLRSMGVARSYKIGVDSRYYSEVNKAEFWPEGIVFRRFRFRTDGQGSGASFPENTVMAAVR